MGQMPAKLKKAKHMTNDPCNGMHDEPVKTNKTTEEQLAGAVTLLRESLHLFNLIPNHTTREGSTYDQAAAITRYLRSIGVEPYGKRN